MPVQHNPIHKEKMFIGLLIILRFIHTQIFHPPGPHAKLYFIFRYIDIDQRCFPSGQSSSYTDQHIDIGLLVRCLIEWGLPLSLPYTSETIDGFMLHTYNDGDLIACFDENVPESVIKTIAKRQPLRAVFRDSSFASSPEKINVGEIFKSLAPDTRVKVI